MAWLALVAVLLLSAMPTVSRVVMSMASTSAPILVEMCTTAGRSLVEMPAADIDAGQPAHPAAGALDACDYCVLAMPVLLALLLLCMLSLQRAPPPSARSYLPLLRPLRNTRGLGSQAPPIAL